MHAVDPDRPAQPPTSVTGAALAVAAAAAVLLVLALLWNRLPTPAGAPAGGRASPSAPDLPALDACTALVAQRWWAATTAQRANDLEMLPLRAAAAACARSAGSSAAALSDGTAPGDIGTGAAAPVAIYLFDPATRRLLASLHGPAQGQARALQPERVAQALASAPGPGGSPVQGAWSGRGVQRVTPLPNGSWLVVDGVTPAEPDGPAAAAPAAGLHPLQAGLALAALGVTLALGIGLWLLMRARQAERQAWAARWQAQRDAQEAAGREAGYRKALFDAVGVGLRVVDRHGRLTDVNPAFCSLCGWPADSLLGESPPYPFWPRTEHPLHSQYLQAVLDGDSAADGYQVRFERPGGDEWWAHVIARPLPGDAGWILACTDITQARDARRRVDALVDELRRLSSVSLLGQRAGDLLHQFSNHCGTALHALSAARKQLHAARPEAAAQAVDLALATVGQLGQVVERFRPWLRDEVNLEPCALRDVAEDALVQESGHAQRHHVVLGNQVSAELPAMALDRMALCEVLSNLVHNAIDALADAPLSNRRVSVDSFLDADKGQVLLRVCDLGPGIPAPLREAVFARGFSQPTGTRKPGAATGSTDQPADTDAQPGESAGTGWGLANCRYWVEKLGGTIRIADHSPQGTAVEIRLPLPALTGTL